MPSLHYTHLIWDFNGTILDDVDVCIQSANALLSSHSLPTLSSKEQYRALFGFPICDYYQRLGFDFSVTPYADLAVEWVRYYTDFCRYGVLYKGVFEALCAVWARGDMEQWVLSATELVMLKEQLSSLGIDSYFHGVLGLDNIHANSKTALALSWRDQHPEALPLMLGDTHHDAEVALAMGADCVLLTTGHQTREELEKQPCLFVADSATEALERLGIAGSLFPKSANEKENLQ